MTTPDAPALTRALIHLGKGPCRQGHENDDIPLTGETVQAPDGGTWWRVAAGQGCAVCGQPFDWMYEGPIVLELPALVAARDFVEVPDADRP